MTVPFLDTVHAKTEDCYLDRSRVDFKKCVFFTVVHLVYQRRDNCTHSKMKAKCPRILRNSNNWVMKSLPGPEMSCVRRTPDT